MFKVVVVEDSSIVRKGIIFTTDWAAVECEVIGEAENGIEGIAVIERCQPDIVLTDIKMPGLDGVQMIEALKGKTKAFFIIMSAYGEFEYARRALQLGVADYLMKPIDEQDLLNTMINVCKIIKQQRNISKIQNKIDQVTESRVMLFKEYLQDGTSVKSYYVQKVVNYIQQNYYRDLSVKNISDELELSSSYISRIFKEESGYSMVDYLTYYRMKQACKLLGHSETKIYEVASEIGYRDQRYFSSMFKKIVGVTPKEFRDRLNE